MEQHPGAQIVSRDRYTNYSNAITAALPHAVQVVDRWHLLKNLCDGLKKLVERNQQHLKYAGSNGLVEGLINKLKSIKRQMYGRASFKLLRKRLLLNSS